MDPCRLFAYTSSFHLLWSREKKPKRSAKFFIVFAKENGNLVSLPFSGYSHFVALYLVRSGNYRSALLFCTLFLGATKAATWQKQFTLFILRVPKENLEKRSLPHGLSLGIRYPRNKHGSRGRRRAHFHSQALGDLSLADAAGRKQS